MVWLCVNKIRLAERRSGRISFSWFLNMLGGGLAGRFEKHWRGILVLTVQQGFSGAKNRNY